MILKRKLRYILIEASDDIEMAAASAAVLNGLLRFLGEKAYADANPRIIRQYGKRLFSMRVNRNTEKKAVLGLAFVRTSRGSAGFYTLKISGTLRKIAEYAAAYSAHADMPNP